MAVGLEQVFSLLHLVDDLLHVVDRRQKFYPQLRSLMELVYSNLPEGRDFYRTRGIHATGRIRC